MAEIARRLREREEAGSLRALRPISIRQEGKVRIDNREYFDFSSNDYLGLSAHPALKIAAKEAIDKFGTSSCASRLLSGDLELHHRLEEETANFKGKEAALVFNSGYQANLGIISALYSKSDCIFADRLSHASIMDGILLCAATLFRFRHNDHAHLGELLKKERGKFRKALIITESIFSMDGDRAPLKDLVFLKEKYNCQIFVDEAHATGIFGNRGSGVVEEEGLSEQVDFIMGTFSKALGSFGAYLASFRETIAYLINTCRSFIYSTALPPSVIACNLASINLIQEEPWRRVELLNCAGYLRSALKDKGFQVKGSSQIVPVVAGGNFKAMAWAEKLQGLGYWVLPIRPPTVPNGEARLRFSLTYHHKKEILAKLVDHLYAAGI
jgi:8-amino-7-oxononanoate synthase